jgi:hypothetical protein
MSALIMWTTVSLGSSVLWNTAPGNTCRHRTARHTATQTPGRQRQRAGPLTGVVVVVVGLRKAKDDEQYEDNGDDHGKDADNADDNGQDAKDAAGDLVVEGAHTSGRNSKPGGGWCWPGCCGACVKKWKSTPKPDSTTNSSSRTLTPHADTHQGRLVSARGGGGGYGGGHHDKDCGHWSRWSSSSIRPSA